jgi:hypothetical protein
MTTNNDLIEQAVQASIDAGLAVNGEHGVASARVAARYVYDALTRRSSAGVKGETKIEAQPIHALPMPPYDFQGNAALTPSPTLEPTDAEVERDEMTVTDEMGRALVAKYREIWPGAGWPPLDIAKELLRAAFAMKGETP